MLDDGDRGSNGVLLAYEDLNLFDDGEREVWVPLVEGVDLGHHLQERQCMARE